MRIEFEAPCGQNLYRLTYFVDDHYLTFEGYEILNFETNEFDGIKQDKSLRNTLNKPQHRKLARQIARGIKNDG